MSDSLLVRTSRDGDQFHYLWATRRALRLLKPQSTLVALTIEGASTTEMGSQPVVEQGLKASEEAIRQFAVNNGWAPVRAQELASFAKKYVG